MKYTVKGAIKSIGEKKTLDNGAVVLDYVLEVTEDNGHVDEYGLSLYKKDEYVKHIDNFIQYNKVGDNVEVEFGIRGFRYNSGDVGNSLSHWSIKNVSEVPTEQAEAVDDLPF